MGHSTDGVVCRLRAVATESDTPGNESAAVWSPDGSTLLYNLNTGATELWMMEAGLLLK